MYIFATNFEKMKTLNNSFTIYFSILFLVFFAISSCKDEPSCSDGIQNQGETGIDCHVEGDPNGPCPPCEFEPNYNAGGNPNTPTDTTGNDMPTDTTDTPIDTTDMPTDTTNVPTDTTDNTNACGTDVLMCATVEGFPWIATNTTASFTTGVLAISGEAADNSSINISYFGVLQPGSVEISPSGNQSITFNDGYDVYIANTVAGSGTITITMVDDTNKTVSGTFDMVGFTPGGAESIGIVSGQFFDLKYQ